MLFDEKERPSQDSRSYAEGDWDYLDRSGRVEAQRVRTFLNYWDSQYPVSDGEELISRIRNGDDRGFQSATFEVILFALLRCLKCSITVHPPLANGNRRHPDFLAVTPDGESVYVEAVLASEFSEGDIAARRRTDAVLTAIDKINSPNFFLAIDAEGKPETPPSSKRLRKELELWLDSLSPDAVAQRLSIDGPEALPKIAWITRVGTSNSKPFRRGLKNAERVKELLALCREKRALLIFGSQ